MFTRTQVGKHWSKLSAGLDLPTSRVGYSLERQSVNVNSGTPINNFFMNAEAVN